MLAAIDIEIHQPELEALIQQRMANGVFHHVEDALIDALKSASPPEGADASPSNEMSAVPEPLARSHESFSKILESFRGLLTGEEVETSFVSNPSVARPLDLL